MVKHDGAFGYRRVWHYGYLENTYTDNDVVEDKQIMNWKEKLNLVP